MCLAFQLLVAVQCMKFSSWKKCHMLCVTYAWSKHFAYDTSGAKGWTCCDMLGENGWLSASSVPHGKHCASRFRTTTCIIVSIFLTVVCIFWSFSCHLYSSDQIIWLRFDWMKSLPEYGTLALVYDETEVLSRKESQQIKLFFYQCVFSCQRIDVLYKVFLTGLLYTVDQNSSSGVSILRQETVCRNLSSLWAISYPSGLK